MVHLDNIFHYCICYIKIGRNKNFPNYLNVMVNYHYHKKTQSNYPVITIYFACRTLNDGTYTGYSNLLARGE